MIQKQSATSANPEPNRNLSAATVGRDYLNEYHGQHRNKRICALLETIYELSIARCDGHDMLDPSFLSFTPTEIATEMGRSKADSSDPTQDGKKVTGWWDKGKVQDEMRAGLDDRARRNGSSYIPWIVKDPGGGYRRPSSYRFTAQAIDIKAEQAPYESVPNGWIRYYRESERRPTFAPLVNKPLGGLGSKVMLGILAPLFAMTALYLWIGVIQLLRANLLAGAQDMAIGLFAAWMIYLLSGHLYRSRQMGVLVAGFFTSPINDDEPTQLVSDRTEEGRRVLLVKFYSKCEVPGCGARVTVRNGKGAEKGRLLGCCERSPREHVYTFDHVTGLGHPLRTAAALSPLGRDRP